MGSEHYKKPDHWALKARQEGYPARSVYKLIEIDEKFKVFRPGMRVLDLGAAPGSWALYTVKRIGPSGFLAAIDLAPLAIKLSPLKEDPLAGSLFIQGDLYAAENCRALLERGPYQVVMSDAAPSTTGNSLVDTGRSEELVRAALDYARAALSPGGTFIAKLFQGGDQNAVLKELKAEFADARGFKPKACRNESFEMYLVATGKRAGGP
jgi:23S rRNA (uridine2552-2'-O)-methyltransferase